MAKPLDRNVYEVLIIYKQLFKLFHNKVGLYQSSSKKGFIRFVR